MSQTATKSVYIDGSELTVADISVAANACEVRFVAADDVKPRMAKSAAAVDRAVREQQQVYGVTTGFGGMAGVAVDGQDAAASQANLLSFLATGTGDEINRRHVRAAMLLRANVLAQGCSGVRFELVERLLRFLEADASPVVRELGSIGASGDLVPLSAIGRAITGASEFSRVRLGGRLLSGPQALAELGLEPLTLRPKEGLALVNGTSFSSAVCANAIHEAKQLMSLTMAIQGMMMQALMVQTDPFDEFVHRKKPHPGQIWSAMMMQRLLTEGHGHINGTPANVQDRYSLRCFPQYMGSIVESVAGIIDVVETEMNAVSDNPLVDVEGDRLCQSGNFLGQYLAIAMDDLRRDIGLMAKHLDVQIATIVSPEFSNGLPPSLRGNGDVAYNMGLKGLQITGNSIMPMLTWAGHSLVDHYPTHAEQFNQNINGLSWGAANLAWKSVGLFRHYLSVSAIFAVQALDLRSKLLLDHFDGGQLLGSHLQPVYEAICGTMNVEPTSTRPLLFDDSDLWLEQHLAELHDNIEQHGCLMQSVSEITEAFDQEF